MIGLESGNHFLLLALLLLLAVASLIFHIMVRRLAQRSIELPFDRSLHKFAFDRYRTEFPNSKLPALCLTASWLAGAVAFYVMFAKDLVTMIRSLSHILR